MSVMPERTMVMNAFCRSFLHAMKRRNKILAILSCRAFLIRMRQERPN